MIYKCLARPLLFNLWSDPEDAHEFAMVNLARISRSRLLLAGLGAMTAYRDPSLERTLWDIRFPNPIGLAGGFDKNARAVTGFEKMGFGFLELGTVTRHPQPGNPRPRVFRYRQDEALVNRFGFNNDGAEAVADRLSSLTQKPKIPIGISIGKSKVTPLGEAVEDYLFSLRALYPHGDYFAVNVSSPNTPGLRQLQDRTALDELLEAITHEAATQHSLSGGDNSTRARRKPILVKIAPDLEPEALDELLEVCLARSIDGIIATNTTLSRDGLNTLTTETGGLSGRPLYPRSVAMVRHIRQQLPEMPIIGVGGISTVHHAWDMLRAGADLLQIYTALIYEGPFLPRRLNAGIAKNLRSESIASMADLAAMMARDKEEKPGP